jgi:hypothetical protein
VSAGICAGVLLTGSAEDAPLAKRGLAINLSCGDFIEACYPIMEQYPLVNAAGYLASACSVAMLSSSCKSSAYLPFPIALWLAEDWIELFVSSLLAMGIPFVATVANNVIVVRVARKDFIPDAKRD